MQGLPEDAAEQRRVFVDASSRVATGRSAFYYQCDLAAARVPLWLLIFAPALLTSLE